MHTCAYMVAGNDGIVDGGARNDARYVSVSGSRHFSMSKGKGQDGTVTFGTDGIMWHATYELVVMSCAPASMKLRCACTTSLGASISASADHLPNEMQVRLGWSQGVLERFVRR